MGVRQVRSEKSYFYKVYCINFSLLSNFLNGVCCEVGRGGEWRGDLTSTNSKLSTKSQNKLNANQNPTFCKCQLTAVSWINGSSLVALTPGLFIKKKLYTLNTRQTISVIMISFLINPGRPNTNSSEVPPNFSHQDRRAPPPGEGGPPTGSRLSGQGGNGEESSNNVQSTRDK